jgi:hypothetical protein
MGKCWKIVHFESRNDVIAIYFGGTNIKDIITLREEDLEICYLTSLFKIRPNLID